MCHSLDLPGGIERAIVNTANMFRENGRCVTLLILDSTPNLFYPLDEGIRILQYPLHLGITEKGNAVTRKIALFAHLLKLRRMLKGIAPDVVIGTDASLTATVYMASLGRGYKLMAWEHHHAFHFSRSAFWRAAINYVYPRLGRIITLNEEEAGYFRAKKCRTSCIPNYVEQMNLVSERATSKRLLTVGWLSVTKGMDSLAAVAEMVKRRHPDWEWLVVGDGELKPIISRELIQRNLADFVKIVSPQSHQMVPVYESAQILVMLSRKECLPMVLLEAHAGGLPCVAFDCPTGPRHIIAHGKSGLLVEPGNTRAMAEAIGELIENKALRIEMGENAVHIAERFSKAAVIAMWSELFQMP